MGEKNVGPIDKGIRTVLAIVFLILGIGVHWGFYILTAILVYTVVAGFCLPYKWLGINTAGRKAGTRRVSVRSAKRKPTKKKAKKKYSKKKAKKKAKKKKSKKKK